MEVVTQWKPGTDLMEVWIRQPGIQGFLIGRVEPDGSMRMEEYEPGEMVPPTLRLQSQIWDALSSKAAGVLPPSASTERHLADATAVRDRLLSLVEKGYDPN